MYEVRINQEGLKMKTLMNTICCALIGGAAVLTTANLHERAFGVGSEVAHQSAMLATVRRSNRACSFPAHGFHEDSTSRGGKRRN